MSTENKKQYEVPMIEIIEFNTKNSIAESVGQHGAGFFEEM
ncbi:hypothetical protein [Acholeplasma equirhinis]|nr:hypothetical protein [Acholeplasma equirhinis]